jgi:transposase
MSKRRKSSKKKQRSPAALPTIRPNVAGIDLGSEEHWVCGPARENEQPNVETFGTTTPELERLANWLLEQDVESVAMESTGVYWIPIYELLESLGFEVLLANARHLKNVPGRKTDMIDCQWVQLLHSCGLLRGSYRPADAICRLRAIRRQQQNLIEQRTTYVQWMQKALDQMNIQVHRAVTDITGKTGMAIIRAIVAGQRDPFELAKFRDPRCKKSEAQIADHLTGNWRDEHLFNLASALHLYDGMQQMIASYDARLNEELEALQAPERKHQPVPKHANPKKEKAIAKRGEQALREHLWRFAGVDLCRIDGISTSASLTVLTEVGLDLTAFPSEGHFVSWLTLAPRTPYSGGKPLPKKHRKAMSATRVANVLRMCAQTLQRSKTALGAYFRRTARHKDHSVAVFATARKLAELIYRMLRFGQDYMDIGEQAYEAQFQRKRLAGIRSAAKNLGFELVPLSV